jgi:hypothetical protein
MIASAGAGPPPLHHTELTTDTLAAAIARCLSSECFAAAQKIKQTMTAENGVQTAVASFHRGLPVDALCCELLPNETAVWTWRGGKKRFKLSAKAVAILTSRNKIQTKDLAMYVALSRVSFFPPFSFFRYRQTSSFGLHRSMLNLALPLRDAGIKANQSTSTTGTPTRSRRRARR